MRIIVIFVPFKSMMKVQHDFDDTRNTLNIMNGIVKLPIYQCNSDTKQILEVIIINMFNEKKNMSVSKSVSNK